MASQTLILGNPTFLPPPPLGFKHNFASSPKCINFSNFSKPHSLTLSNANLISFPNAKLSSMKNPKIYASSSNTSADPSTNFLIKPPSPTQFQVSESTRTLTTLLTITLSLSKLFAQNFANSIICKIPNQGIICSTTGSFFFAAINNRAARGSGTPLAVVAAGMATLVGSYSKLLQIRMILTWFPNIPWDKQPLSALGDLCDPFLNLFRNLIPLLFNAVDIGPLMAFVVLGCFTEILNTLAMPF